MKGSLTKRFKTSWRYRFDSNRHLGGSRKIISGTIRSTTKKVAEEELRAIMAKHDKGDFVEPNKRTLKEYLEYWLPIIKPSIAPKTFEGDEQKIKKYHLRVFFVLCTDLPHQKLELLATINRFFV